MPYTQTKKEVERPQQMLSMKGEEQTASGIDRKMVWILSIASAMAVANLYYIQPLLADIGRNFAVDARIITSVMLVLMLAAFVLFWLVGQWLWGLIIGVILLDFGMQGTHISNQTRIFRLQPEARSRLNTVYMVSYFIGGSLGSILGAYGWSIGRWAGVCTVGTLMLVAALAVRILSSRSSA